MKFLDGLAVIAAEAVDRRFVSSLALRASASP